MAQPIIRARRLPAVAGNKSGRLGERERVRVPRPLLIQSRRRRRRRRRRGRSTPLTSRRSAAVPGSVCAARSGRAREIPFIKFIRSDCAGHAPAGVALRSAGARRALAGRPARTSSGEKSPTKLRVLIDHDERRPAGRPAG